MSEFLKVQTPNERGRRRRGGVKTEEIKEERWLFEVK